MHAIFMLPVAFNILVFIRFSTGDAASVERYFNEVALHRYSCCALYGDDLGLNCCVCIFVSLLAGTQA